MNVFNSVKGLHPRRNKFSAHTYRNDFTAYMGLNTLCYQQHVPAATRAKVDTSALVRLQALIAPIMDNVDYYVHFWQIPYRLLENDRFTQFFTGEIEPEEYDALFLTPFDFADALFSYYAANGESLSGTFGELYSLIVGNGGLMDFAGYDSGLFPEYDDVDEEMTGGNSTTVLNFRPIIAYFMVHQNWYMNENVPYFENFSEMVEDLVKNQSSQALAGLLLHMVDMQGFGFLPHGWDKDYFTSGLPNVQFGDPVTLPIGGSAPVTIPDQPAVLTSLGGGSALRLGIGGELAGTSLTPLEVYNELPGVSTEGDFTTDEGVVSSISGVLKSSIPDTSLMGTADLSEATAITINELRFANALQVFKERQMRFGRRRLEFYKGFFDVTPEDLRLQVPRYLGGGRIPINIADIEQTSSTTGSQALGHLAGKGTAVAGNFAGFTTFCSEESIIIGIAFSMPHQTYAQALSRFLFKTNDIYSYFNPSFEHLGEQSILNVELFSGAGQPEGEFAYTPRYNEYRFHLNEMHGDFKGSLSYWTLGRVFDSQPALNAEFVYMQPQAFNRIFAVANQPNLLVSMLFRTRLIQPVSKYGTPMLLA